MAKRIDNSKGFLVIEMTPDEAINICGFGFHDNVNKQVYLVCDICNELLNSEEQVYYIAVIDRLVDKKCCNYWISHSKRYDEDISYETKQFTKYATKLSLV